MAIQEVAATERVRHQISSHASRHRDAYSTGHEELYHQQVQRPSSAAGNQSSVGVSTTQRPDSF